MDSSGVDGSMEGYWSWWTCLVNCALLTKKSTGRDSISATKKTGIEVGGSVSLALDSLSLEATPS